MYGALTSLLLGAAAGPKGGTKLAVPAGDGKALVLQDLVPPSGCDPQCVPSLSLYTAVTVGPCFLLGWTGMFRCLQGGVLLTRDVLKVLRPGHCLATAAAAGGHKAAQ